MRLALAQFYGVLGLCVLFIHFNMFVLLKKSTYKYIYVDWEVTLDQYFTHVSNYTLSIFDILIIYVIYLIPNSQLSALQYYFSDIEIEK